MFRKDAFGATMRATAASANGYGYAALHNIMRAVHPNVVEKVVEPITHYQGNVVTLAAHVRNMTNHLEKESLHGRLYTKYESPMMFCESLHGRYKELLKNKVELDFTANHDHVEKVPFKLEMANIGTTLAEWADEMKLDVPRVGPPDEVNHIGNGRSQHAMDYVYYQYDDGVINTVGSDQTCTICGMNGHDLENCHLLINMVKGLDFIKSFPDAVSNIH
jgi:hypothetical protein